MMPSILDVAWELAEAEQERQKQEIEQLRARVRGLEATIEELTRSLASAQKSPSRMSLGN